MEEKKLISIVLPTYNGEKFLAESIESVINQTYQNWELIIVNDCSTDSTLNIANYYAEKDNRIKVISNEKNLKLPQSLNTGFSYAKGEYFSWTSDDNIYHNNALEYMIEFLDNNKNYDLISCDYELIEENGEFKQNYSELHPRKFVELSRNAVVGACFLYTKEIAQKTGQYSKNAFCAEDFDYWCRMALVGNIYFSDKVLYKYRFNSQSLSSTKEKLVKNQLAKIRIKYALKILKKCGFSTQKIRHILLGYYLEYFNKTWLYVALKDSIFSFFYVFIKAYLFVLREEHLFLSCIKEYNNKKLAFWGASIFLKNFIKKYHIKNKNIIGIIDKDSNKWGEKLGNYTIFSPEKIKELKIDKIIFTIKNKNAKIYPKVKSYLEEYEPEVELLENKFIMFD